ncbi:MAG: hypothetical protein Q7J25_11060 [Vicinamibacterales bacterium]|nr:hypothetical protein [Vicinamibacterales bacterium]
MVVPAPHSLRSHLARLTALVVIGLALAATSGIAGTRAGLRDRTRGARISARGGSQRLEAADGRLHDHDEVAPDARSASALGSTVTPAGDHDALPGLVTPAFRFPPPLLTLHALAAEHTATLRSPDERLSPPGRAPPSA